jgi:hypothetical protein
MPAKKRTKASRKVQAKARGLLMFAEEEATRSADWVGLHNALFGLDGKATALFPTEADRTALSRTAEYRKILALLDGLPSPPVMEFAEMAATTNRLMSVRPARAALKAGGGTDA